MEKKFVINDIYYELVQKEPFKGLTISLPSDYTVMDTSVRFIKYPNIAQNAVVFTNRDTTCNVIIQNLNLSIPKENFQEFVEQNKKVICFQLPSVAIIDELSQFENMKHLFYRFSYKVPCMDSDCYNEMFYGCFRSYVLLINFNCLDSKSEEMKELFKQIAETITFKEAL